MNCFYLTHDQKVGRKRDDQQLKSFIFAVMTPLVSIIMPVKNAAPWLKECLHSILNQDMEAWELIAVDDHSNDDSWRILEAFSERDPRIQCVKNTGSGIIDALHVALQLASAAYITRMDADDLMAPHKLQTFWELLQQQKDVVVTGKVEYFSQNEVSEGYRNYEHWLNERCDALDHWKWMYRECTIASANWMTHRDNVVLEPGVYPEDYHLVFHWYAKGLNVKASDGVTHHWREHPKRTSRHSKHYAQAAFFELKLDHFLHRERDSNRALAVMGKNKKAKLCTRFFKAQKTECTIIDMERLYLLSELDRPQVLIAVYPTEELMRQGIVQLMDSFGLEMGVDWWWV